MTQSTPIADEVREEIIGAVARGWTHPTTSNKVMDIELAQAIVEEVSHLLASAVSREQERIYKSITPLVEILVKAIPKYKRREKVNEAIALLTQPDTIIK